MIGREKQRVRSKDSRPGKAGAGGALPARLGSQVMSDAGEEAASSQPHDLCLRAPGLGLRCCVPALCSSVMVRVPRGFHSSLQLCVTLAGEILLTHPSPPSFHKFHV